MKFLAMAALCLTVVSCQNGPGGSSGGSTTLKTQIDSVSYSIGMNFGNGLRTQLKQDTTLGIKVDLLETGFNDALNGKKVQLTDTQAQKVMSAFQEQMIKKQQETAAKQGEKNKTEGEKFLADNAKKSGVKTTASGLQYEVIKDGTGPIPDSNAQVTVSYKGMLLDGSSFDSSRAGQPATFAVRGVIPGWTEALKMMKTGSKWKLYIPSALAYGHNPPPGGKIGPDAVLVFEIELIKINDKSENPAGANPMMGHPGK
ncbi:MAG: FKBP-type peptidyl-prolyl cis-trans isomerase [Candidatus Kapaibacterium sp.]